GRAWTDPWLRGTAGWGATPGLKTSSARAYRTNALVDAGTETAGRPGSAANGSPTSGRPQKLTGRQSQAPKAAAARHSARLSPNRQRPRAFATQTNGQGRTRNRTSDRPTRRGSATKASDIPPSPTRPRPTDPRRTLTTPAPDYPRSNPLDNDSRPTSPGRRST